MNGRSLCTYALVLGFGLSIACSNSITTLTETSAKRLLQEHFDHAGQQYTLPLASVAEEMRTTHEDYVAHEYPDASPQAVAKRLIKAGYIKEAREDITYKNVTESYKADMPGCHGMVPGLTIKNRAQTFTLGMQPGSPAVSGQYTYDSWFEINGKKSLGWSGPVKGTVNENGTVELIY
jgi:hypothetical protein